MKILFVAMAESVHSARWLGQLAGLGWDLHFFPSWSLRFHPEFRNVVFHPPYRNLKDRPPPGNRVVSGPLMLRAFWKQGKRWMPGIVNEPRRLARLIDKLRPDIVHSMELQHAGYLTLDAFKLVNQPFPTWLATNWGSDTYLFGQLPEHRERIRELLQHCDYYSCECERDVRAARELGFRGTVWPVMPNTGGFDLPRVARLRQPGRTSERRLIALKGNQGWVGRALVGLRAIELCADVLKDYRVAIYNANPDVELAAKLLAVRTGMTIEVVPPVSHEEMLRLHGRARVSMGLSISDGVSTSFLEALVMGAFPIQSYTAAADEWIEHGRSGWIVHPEDPEEIAVALRRAVTDDELVDRASALNAETARRRLDYATIRQRVVSLYREMATLGSNKAPQRRAA